ncbi:glutamate ABC transporter substrate-binding protein [Nocardioides sp. SYSU D00038]|uniref:glutamate ABC transporter substrate-binding protein n=1 Tax=Nocardioides sp. SYSU D00038 TaxID=2812554 RepID=UPI0019677ADA|nr:glutamate ABC transporter substrate-binding protein [Nocardioides sp. SYSU D00038]
MNRRLALAVAAAALAVAGCGYDATVVPAPEAPEAPAAAGPAEECADDVAGLSPVRSYAPTGPLPAPGDIEADPDGSTVERIKAEGTLVVGVAADSFNLAYRNPETGVLEGFDIEMAKEVARAIFGTSTPQNTQFRVITPAQRFPLLQEREVDIVVRNMTINCARWELIAFSAEYFHSGQKILVRRNAGIDDLRDLAGLRICAPAGTTSIQNIETEIPGAIPVTAANDTQCMVKFQRGEADALSTDDTVLAGLAAQDPYSEVLDQEALTDEPYGIGVNAEQVDLVQFINAMLERMRRDGTWDEHYDRWLRPTLGDPTGKWPQPQYGRPLP